MGSWVHSRWIHANSILLRCARAAQESLGNEMNARITPESVHDSPFGLANILFVASVASDSVYHVVCFTGEVFHVMKLSAMMAADNVATSVYFRTISAVFSFANIRRLKRQEFSMLSVRGLSG